MTAGVDTEAVRFQHPTRPGGSRFDLKPFVSMPLEGAGWFIKPTLAWRYTAYHLDDDACHAGLTAIHPRAACRSARSTPACISIARPAGVAKASCRPWSRGCSTCACPTQDQSDLPLFDTRPLTFSWGQLFRDNRYTGADRQTDANQMTVALSSRLIRAIRRQGEARGQPRPDPRISPTRNVTCPGETPVERGKSAWIADASWSINDRWTVGASYQWDPKFSRQDLASFRTRYLIGDEGMVNLGYRYRRDLLEQADLSFLYPVDASLEPGRALLLLASQRQQTAGGHRRRAVGQLLPGGARGGAPLHAQPRTASSTTR